MLTYKTIKSTVSFEIPKIKWSKFIGHLFPIISRADAESKLKQVQKQHYQATHNCPSRRAGLRHHQDLFGTRLVDSLHIYSSDDGEPSGTAAYPMKNTLAGEKLENILLVITRYFGWTMLGVWGLVKAYTDCSKAVIEKAEIIEKEVLEEIQLKIKQENVPEFLKFCRQKNIKISEQNYSDIADFKVSVNVAFAQEFRQNWLVEM